MARKDLTLEVQQGLARATSLAPEVTVSVIGTAGAKGHHNFRRRLPDASAVWAVDICVNARRYSAVLSSSAHEDVVVLTTRNRLAGSLTQHVTRRAIRHNSYTLVAAGQAEKYVPAGRRAASGAARKP